MAEIAEVSDKHGDALIRFAASQVGWADAEDVVATAVVGVLRSAPAALADTRAYLYRSVANAAADHWRSNDRRARRESVFVVPPSPGTGETSDEEIRLSSALVALSPQQRAFIHLTYWEDLTRRRSRRRSTCRRERSDDNWRAPERACERPCTMQTDERRASSGDDPLHEPLRRTLGRLGDAAGPPPAFDQLTVPSLDTVDRTRPRRSERWALGAAAAVLLVVATVLVVGRDGGPADRVATETATTDAAAAPATNPGSVERQTPDTTASPTSPAPPATASPPPPPTPPGTSTTVAVEPGQTVAEIRDLVAATALVTPAEFDAALADAEMPTLFDGPLTSRLVSREGLLGVGNHPVTADADALVAAMIGRFDALAAEVGLADAAIVIETPDGAARALGPYEIVIVASLVKAETTVDAERPRIARVILNRLASGELLGIDSALVYALGRPIETQADLEIDSPYNLRRYPGLPPRPIGAPSRASLAAAVDPEPGDWLFYVRTDEDGPGTHRFTANLEEFVEGVELCIARQLGCGSTPAGD